MALNGSPRHPTDILHPEPGRADRFLTAQFPHSLLYSLLLDSIDFLQLLSSILAPISLNLL